MLTPQQTPKGVRPKLAKPDCSPRDRPCLLEVDPDFDETLLERDMLNPESSHLLEKRLKMLPQLKPFWTIAQYAELDFELFDVDRQFPAYSRFMKHQWMYDHHYLRDFGYVLATREVMDTLADQLSGRGLVLDAGSGSGYLSHELRRMGVETFAVDADKSGLPVFQRNLTGDAVSCISSRISAVLLAWPPFEDRFAVNVAQAMLPGQLLIYQGENGGGCTADSAFFDYVSDQTRWRRRFDLSNELDAVHVTFSMNKDHWLMFEKI